ncbi:hypothetical protein M8J76_006540 [Diaphorina citri]|nr:hypothetical protein M8J75_007137 [Diaphorina citri]KAI5723464.1 hypothetical protein M8J76_006540 [Diaphorina citri]KAI5728905.1 hypothetical protein M8J77_023051 [Diaphorina citri]
MASRLDLTEDDMTHIENAIKNKKNFSSIDRAMSVQAMQALNEFREKNLLCDATIVLADNSHFPIHRNILCACSDYFRALFTTSLHDQEKFSLVEIPGVDASVMTSLIEYAYLRKLHITEDNVASLLLATDFFCMSKAQDLCCDFIKRLTTPRNCFGILLFSRDHFCKKLEEWTRKYILRNFVDVARESEEIVFISEQELEEIISSDELNVKSEETVWELIIRWIDYDPENRKKHIVSLMKNIRLGLLETEFFREKVKHHPYVQSTPECRPIIIETFKFLYDLELIAQIDGEVPTPEIARPRVPHEILFAIGGWSGGSPTDFVETYDTRADRWVKIDQVDPMGPRAYHGTAVIGYNIYVIGGFDGNEYYNSCRCFNAVTKVWKEIAPMNFKRCYVSTAVHQDVIYAMGGYNGQRRQNSVEKYNYTENQWSLIAPMNVERSDASATTLQGKIYITGGFNGHNCLNSCEVYDPECNQWTLIEPMRHRRSGVSCIAYHECIYVIGGFNGMSRMCNGEKYNPLTKTWSQVPDMYNPRSNFAIEVIDDMIFAIGGFNGVTTIYHVECYDEKTDEWYEATDMNIYRSALSACVIMGLPNVYDYIHQHRDSLMEEKRQKLLAIEGRQRQNQEESNSSVQSVVPSSDSTESSEDVVQNASSMVLVPRYPAFNPYNP